MRSRLSSIFAAFALPACALALSAAALAAQSVAPGDTIHLRLLDRVGKGHHAPRVVRALVIAPLTRVSGEVIIPPGSIVSGRVTGAGKERYAGKRHWIGLALDSIAIPVAGASGDTVRTALALRIASVDDARESIDSAGRIVGPPTPSMLRSKRDWAIVALGFFQPVGAIVLAAALEGEMVERHRGVQLDAGAELTAVITRGTTLDAHSGWTPPPRIMSGVNPDSIAASAPMRAFLREGGRPSDVISMAVIGSPAQVSAAFAEAGWTLAVPLNLHNGLLTFLRAAKGRGFGAQPVSTLVLDGRAPDHVYEKVADSFLRRHHFRMWRWPGNGAGDDRSTIWLVAATHDTGLMFSMQRRSFTHRVDSHIDLERDKVVSDLVAAGRVAAMSYVPRTAPAGGATANGSKRQVVTDWRMAVVVLREAGEATPPVAPLAARHPMP